MLGRLEMDVDQCIEAYNDLAESVFGERLKRIPMTWRAKTVARFDSSKLEQAVQKVLRQVGEKEDTLFNDNVERSCKTFVCTIDEYSKDIVRLRSYTVSGEPEIRATIVQAARATSAATTFFEPVQIGNHTADLKPLVKCFISIGTGKQATEAMEKNLFKFLGKTVVSIATETENTEKAFIARWRKHFDEDRYFRFNVEQGLQGIGLAEYQQAGAIESATLSYLTNIQQRFRVRDCVENLKKKNYDKNEPCIRQIRLASIMNATTIPQSPKVPFMVPFDPDPDFVPRLDTEGRDIMGQLFSNFRRRRRMGLVGLGGVGKSQIAIEFAHQFRNQNPKGAAVFWVQAGDSDHFNMSYSHVARELGLDTPDEPMNNSFHVAELVCGTLSNPDYGNWLMILDNLDDLTVLKAAFSETDSPPAQRRADYSISHYIPRSANGSILITSRSMSIVLEMTNSASALIHVQDMNTDEAQLLLKHKVWPHAYTSEECRQFVEHMEGLPIAITQAAAYMSKCRMSVKEYIDLFEQNESTQLRLLRKEFKDWRRDERPQYAVIFTWHTSFDQLCQHNPTAAKMLSIMSIYHHQGIPSFLLRKAVSDQMELFDSIEPLLDLCLISKRPTGEFYDLHIFVKLATKAWLDARGELDTTQERSLNNIFEALDDVFSHRFSDTHLLLPHFVELIDIEVKTAEDKVENAIFLVFVADMRADTGDYVGAVDLYNRAISRISDALDSNIAVLLNAQSGLSWSMLQSGKQARSKEIAQEAYHAFRGICDTSGWDTPMKKSMFRFCLKIGKVLDITGLIEKSEECSRDILRLAKDIGNMNTLKSALSQLIEHYCHLGDLKQAMDLLAQFDDISDTDEHMIASSRRVRGCYHLHNGEQSEATAILGEAWTERIKTLGESHPWTLISVVNYLAVLKHSDPLRAENIAYQILRQSTNLWGDDNPTVWAIKEHLATCLNRQNNNKKALSLLREVKESRTRVGHLGNVENIFLEVRITQLESITTGQYQDCLKKMMSILKTAKETFPGHVLLHGTVKMSIAELHTRHGAHELAESFFKQILDTYTEHYSEMNLHTLHANQLFAGLLILTRRHNEAQQILLQTLDILKSSYPYETGFIIECKCDLARCYYYLSEKGQLEELHIELHEAALSGVEGISNTTSQNSVLPPIMDLVREHGNITWELSVCESILESNKVVYGPTHKMTLASQNDLARCLRGLGRYAEAEGLDRETLALRTRWLEADDPHILLSMNNLAMVLGDQEKWAEARDLQHECIQGSIRVMGENHIETMKRKNNLVWILKGLNEYDTAETLAEQVLQDRSSSLGPYNEDTLTTRRSLMDIWRTNEKHSQIIQTYEDCIECHERALGATSLLTYWVVWNAADSLTKEGTNIEQASQLFEKVFKADYHKSDAVLFDKSMFFLAYCRLLSSQRRFVDIEHVSREFLAEYEHRYGIQCREADTIKLCLATALREQQRPDEAVGILYPIYLAGTEENNITYWSMITLVQTVDQERFIQPDVLNLIFRWSQMMTDHEPSDIMCKTLEEMGIVLSKKRHIEAHEILQRSLRASSKYYGLNSKEVLTQKQYAANNLWFQGLYSDACREKRLLIEEMQIAVDFNHRLWLEQRFDCAFMTCAWGDIHGATIEGESIMKELAELIGKGDLSMITQYQNLAYMVLLNGEPSRSERIARDSLERVQRIQDHSHSTQKFWVVLPIALAKQGKWKEAMKICRELLLVDIERPQWTTVSEFRGVSLMSIGIMQGGQLEEGLQLAKRVYTEQSRLFGTHHPETLNRFLFLGLALWYKGDYKQARMIVKGAWQSRIIVSGTYNPATLAAASLLGLVHRDMGEYSQAEHFLRMAYVGFQRQLRQGHPEQSRALRDYIVFLASCWKAGKICGDYRHHHPSTCQNCLQAFICDREKDLHLSFWL
ncbi:uncharacterized protein BHQ10_004153 [Talaromyces amestolkiae]|uniref:NB-ARC domain-containing protein n=1 Tax=Talaromyces amestolkiae TaxID=1196081 RepID=A0A364KXC7_TALAM|nr:uncharacterized protein BHQ10_004153 [Talaromyces amestolkiae]RAO68141.1 hypothetical protein BHQ10_004153 [Talaromyces amestolkiae]